MKNLQLTILTPEALERRYDKLGLTKMARLTLEAVSNGYSIATLQYLGLSQDSFSDWLRNIDCAVSMHFKGQSYKIGIFTDFSEVEENRLYFSFKIKKCNQIAHSLSGHDSDGFIYTI